MQNVFFQGPIYWEKWSCFSHRKLLLYLKSLFCITRLCLCMVCAGQSGLVFCDASVSWRGFMCIALWLKCIVGHCCRRMSDCILDTIAAFKVAHTQNSCWDKNNVTYLSVANILKWADTLKHSPTRVKHCWPHAAAPKSAPFIKISKCNRRQRQTRRINVVFGLSALENTCSNSLIKPNFPLSQS